MSYYAPEGLSGGYFDKRGGKRPSLGQIERVTADADRLMNRPTCLNCSTQFEPKSWNSKTCSAACSHAVELNKQRTRIESRVQSMLDAAARFEVTE